MSHHQLTKTYHQLSLTNPTDRNACIYVSQFALHSRLYCLCQLMMKPLFHIAPKERRMIKYFAKKKFKWVWRSPIEHYHLVVKHEKVNILPFGIISWYYETMWFFTVKRLNQSLKSVSHNWSLIIKISKTNKNPKLSFKKNHDWFGHKTRDRIGFHKDALINQQNLVFSLFWGFKLTCRSSDTPWFNSLSLPPSSIKMGL